MPATTTDPQPQTILAAAEGIILGKEDAIRLAFCCLLARGHLLIEDLPGMGKTTLAHTLAKLLGLEYQRVQFTSDMLPADLLGVSIYERVSESFRFHPGPIFAQLLLADEINRATPKTQSALLEAMEERQVTSEGVTRALPEPFFVIATQNPQHQIGTFPLPESQLDRFLMRIQLGYPDAAEERRMLQGEGGREHLLEVESLVRPSAILRWQQEVDRVLAAPALLDYLQALLRETREHPALPHGLSPRAGKAVLQAARAWAWLDEGRDYLLPDDLQRVWGAVVGHRLDDSTDSGGNLAQTILESVAVP
jgi:MoxR-like ATPase